MGPRGSLNPNISDAIDHSIEIGRGLTTSGFEVVSDTDHRRGDLFTSSVITRLPVHLFTHVDAPSHFIHGGPTIDQVPIQTLFGHAFVVDLRDVAPRQPVDVEILEARATQLCSGDIALLATGWIDSCEGTSTEFWRDSPFLTVDAADWLRRRGVVAVGSDFSTDQVIGRRLGGNSFAATEGDFVAHDRLLRHGVPLIECLVDLALRAGQHVFFAALPLRLTGLDGSPCRAVSFGLEKG